MIVFLFKGVGIEVLPGEEICPTCEGIGVKAGDPSIKLCKICKGTGKVDWVAKLMRP